MRDVALLIFVFALLPLVLIRPMIGLVLWAWIGYMSPHRLTWGFAYNFRFNLIVAAVTIIAVFLSRNIKRDMNVENIVKLNFLFLGWTMITTYNAFQYDRAVMQLEQFIKIQVMIFLTLIVIKTRKQLILMVTTVAYSIGFYGIKGGVFTLKSGGKFRVLGPDHSFMGDNNTFAMALLMVIPLLYFLQLQVKNRLFKLVIFAGTALCVLSILATYSRGALIGLSVMMISFILKARHKISVILVVIVIGPIMYQFLPVQWHARMEQMVVSAVSSLSRYQTLFQLSSTSQPEMPFFEELPKSLVKEQTIIDPLLEGDNEITQDMSMRGRLEAWRFCIRLANDRPILGGGFDTFGQPIYNIYLPGTDRRAPHSIFFEVLAEQGYAGLFIWLALHISAILTARKVIRLAGQDPNLIWARDLAAMLQLSLFGYYTSGLFLGMATFDLPYHIIALIAILFTHTKNQIKQTRIPQYQAPVPKVRSSIF